MFNNLLTYLLQAIETFVQISEGSKKALSGVHNFSIVGFLFKHTSDNQFFNYVFGLQCVNLLKVSILVNESLNLVPTIHSTTPVELRFNFFL